MKKFILFATLLSLTACSATEEEITRTDTENFERPETEEDETITASFSSNDSNHYRIIIPYEPSPSRGLSSTNMVSTYNLVNFEDGLTSLSKQQFDPESYYFREGQLFSSEMINGYLKRHLSEEELKTMSDEERESQDAFSNLGLNPSKNGETDEEIIAEEAPLYLSHILEQNYMTLNEEDEFELNGLTIGLAMNSVYMYQTEQYGVTYEKALDESIVQAEGERMANEILERIRANEAYSDLPILFAIFIQSGEDDVKPGHFVSQGIAEPNEIEIENFETINQEFAILPTNETDSVNEAINQEYRNFNSQLSSYFSNFNTSIGRVEFIDGKASSVKIEIPVEFLSKNEIIGMSQYIEELLGDYFNNIKVEVSIKDNQDAYALITKDRNNTVNSYVYE